MIEVILMVVMGMTILLYLYLSHNYNYWRRKGLAQPPTVFGFGNLRDAFFMRKNRGIIYDEIYRSYPEYEAVGVYGFTVPRLLVRSPELIQKIIVSDFSSFHDNEWYVTQKLDPYLYLNPFVLKGEEWKVERTKLSASTSQAKMKQIFPVMKEIIPHLEAFVDEHLGKEIDVMELSTPFIMDNVSNVVFGISSNCFTDPNAKFRKLGDLVLKLLVSVGWKTVLHFQLPQIRDFLGVRYVPTEMNDYFRNMMREVMDYRNKNNVRRNDLFQCFIDKNEGNDVEGLMMYGMTFFLAGIETSTMASARALYELALNPVIQQTLFEELKETYGDKFDPDYDTLNNMPYLDKVIQEVMRKYPAVYALIRECTKPISLDINGRPVDIEVGTPVIVPVLSLHHDPQYYPEPEVFDPERFNEKNKAARPPYTYMPFGEGPRICPALKFGLMQVKLFVANMVYKRKILRCEKTPDRLTFDKGAFLVTPVEEEWVRIEKRE